MSGDYINEQFRDVVLPEWIKNLDDEDCEHITKPWPRGRAADLWIKNGSDLILKIRQLMTENKQLREITDQAKQVFDQMKIEAIEEDALATCVARLKEAAGSPSGMSLPEDFEHAIATVTQLRAIVDAIDFLCDKDDCSVEICYDTPDSGGSNGKIIVRGEWIAEQGNYADATELWDEQEFIGEDLTDCLRQAVEAKKAAEAAKKGR